MPLNGTVYVESGMYLAYPVPFNGVSLLVNVLVLDTSTYVSIVDKSHCTDALVDGFLVKTLNSTVKQVVNKYSNTFLDFGR